MLFEDEHRRWEPMPLPHTRWSLDHHPVVVRVTTMAVAFAAPFAGVAGQTLLRWAADYPYRNITRGYAQLLGVAGIIASLVLPLAAVRIASLRGRFSAAGWVIVVALAVVGGAAGWVSGHAAIDAACGGVHGDAAEMHSRQ